MRYAAGFLALALTVFTPHARSVVAADTVRVVIALTLRGDVPSDDNFLVYRNAKGSGDIEPGHVVWGSGVAFEGLPRCRSGATYEVSTLPLAVGTEVEYRIDRNGIEVPGLSGTVVTGEGRTRVTLTVDYSIGQLPDTALPRP